MLLDLLSDACSMLHIRINDDSCDLLFHTHFISLNPKHDSRHNHKYRVKIGNNVSELSTQTGCLNLTIQVLNIKCLLPKCLIHLSHFCTQ